MSTHVVEELVSKIRMDAGDYLDNSEKVDKASAHISKAIEDAEKRGAAANERLGESMDKLADEMEKANERATESSKKTSEESEKLSSNLSSVLKALTALYVQIKGSRAIIDLANQTSRLNTQLEFTSQRLGIVTADIRRMSAAAAALGGNGQGMVNTMRDMNQSIQEMALMGDSSMMPFMSALNVGMVDLNGNARDAQAVLLDIAGALEQLDPQRAYALASAMGFDDDTINSLIQGRAAMQEMIDMQGDVYVSNEMQLQASRDLIRAQAMLESRWLSLQTVIGNAVTPALIKVTELAEQFVSFLIENEHLVTGAMIAIGGAITAALIPAILRLGGLLAPLAGKIGVIAGLGLAFVALYDDYKVWADGGQSLFDWEKFDSYIKNSEFSVENLGRAFVGLIGNYNNWSEAYQAFTEWLEMSGIVDDGAFSIRGLASSFVELSGDLLRSTGLLEDFALILAHIKDGEFLDAARVAGNIGVKAVRGAYEVTGFAAESATGFVDRALGHDPNESGTLSQGMRRITSFGRGVIDNAGDFVRGDAYNRGGGDDGAIDLNDDKLSEILQRIDRVNAARVNTTFRSSELVNRTIDTMRDVERVINPMGSINNFGGSYAQDSQNYTNSNYVMRDMRSDNSRVSRDVNVTIEEISVRTSANTVTGAGADGVEQALTNRVSNLDLLGAGL